MHILELSFTDDMNRIVFDYVVDGTILIYPTRAAAEEARLKYQERWNLQKVHFMSMEDFKSSLLLPAKPIPEDDKRLLALYQVLSEEDKEYFHLYSYPDLVSWGTQFFGFCAELWEAEIPFTSLNSWQDNPELALRNWQEENIRRLAEIGERYRQFIHAKGFEDLIFHPGAQAAEIPFQSWRIICVNQYYYSKLEQALLSECERAGNELILVYQGVKGIPNSFKHKSLNLAEAWDSLEVKPSIRIIEAENERQAALSFLALESGTQPLGIIDSSFVLKSYSAYFDPEKLKLPSGISICESAWYRVQRIMLEILQEMQQNSGYIPLRLIIKYFGNLTAVKPFAPTWQENDFIAFRQELRELIKREIIYLDNDISRQIDAPQSRIYQFCNALNGVLSQILQIKSTSDLLELLGSELCPQRYSSPEELNNSDLIARVWEAMANFMAIESLGFVKDWAAVFPNPALDIFRLWLDQIKSLRLKRLYAEKQQPVWEISNLLDARNRVYNRLAVFNMVEGILPSSPSAIWLLNEYQRQKLGMKCYEDIRDWERYYFFRLFLCSHETTLYTFIDKDKAIDHSSFIGELQVLLADTPPQLTKCKVCEEELLNAWRRQADKSMLRLPDDIYHSESKGDFFVIPAQPEQDFKGTRLAFSSYDLQSFVTSPFVWYIRGLRKISPLKIPRRELISPTLFGTLLHDYFSQVLAQKGVAHDSYEELDRIFSDSELLSQALREIIQSPVYRYKIPQNYNFTYLDFIVSERLAESLREFYLRYLQKRIEHGSFSLIPEDTETGNRQAELFRYYFEGKEYEIVLSGRADLRLECPDKYYIVDFKTGNAYTEQLIFYEWLYYLLDHPEWESQVESSFWRILDMETDSKTKSDAKKRALYRERIELAVEQNFVQGYALAGKAADRKQYKEISRSDLYIPGGKNATL